MADHFSSLRPDLAQWWREQPMFFVATAPGGDRGHANLSPKGYDTLRVLDAGRVAYLDLTGSGVETIAHVRENGRITLMACAFNGNPRISRIYGRGTVHLVGTPEFDALAPEFPDLAGRRSIIEVAIERVTTSCGYAVPLMDLVDDRDRLLVWAKRKGDDGIAAYWENKNAESIDGLPGIRGVKHAERIARVRARMTDIGIDALLLSVGPDLPYLTGYEAMPLERLTMLVLPRTGDIKLVIPRLEAPRVEWHPELFEVVPWDETDDPVALVAGMVRRSAKRVGIGDHTWARFVLALQREVPSCTFSLASEVVAPIRMVKDADEIDALTRAAHAVDAVARDMRSVGFAGRTELDVHRELVERMLAGGHERSNFAIVAAGANAASPHHEPTAARTIGDGDIVLCDFGGTMAGYCSDITRMFHVGEPPAEIADVYGVLVAAQEAGVRAAMVGAECLEVDAASRSVIAAAGFGELFVHRVGHGIGTEAHEAPYMVAGNAQLVEPGHAFSVEPGIYFPERFGMRLEDIVVATAAGPVRLNEAPRDIAIVA